MGGVKVNNSCVDSVIAEQNYQITNSITKACPHVEILLKSNTNVCT